MTEDEIVSHIRDVNMALHFMSIALAGDITPHKTDDIDTCPAKTCVEAISVIEELREVYEKAWMYDDLND